MTAKPRVRCPECNKACKRLIGAGAGIIFKGSGFYETDYKAKSGGKDGDNGKKADAKSETKSESKSETKTETKTDSKSDSKPKKDTSSK